MLNYILFDDKTAIQLLPFTFTRPCCEIRVGILTITEKWEHFLGTRPSFHTQDYLREKYTLTVKDDNVLINGSVLPDDKLKKEIDALKENELLKENDVIIAARLSNKNMPGSFPADESFEKSMQIVPYTGANKLNNTWDVFAMNQKCIADDFTLLTNGRKSVPIPTGSQAVNPENIFIEEGASLTFAMLNASEGPIYIGRNAEVMEGAAIRGPFSLGDYSQVKMGAKIYGATTIGPHCKVGGEVSNSVIFGFTNKAHDGFLGNSVLGEWCNLGADSNNSNLKNNYSGIKVWSYSEKDFISTGLQFCGLIMGDHSKCSINTMFNTGTVVGVSANIFGNGFPPKYIPGFSWGGSEGFETYKLEQAMDVARRVFDRRKMKFDQVEKKIFEHLFNSSTVHRSW